MPDNILEIVAHNLGYPELKKIDPNSQEPKEPEHNSEQAIAQAAVPAVLAAIYKLTRSNEGAAFLLNTAPTSDDLLHNIYMGNEQEAVSKIANYAGIPEGEAESRMEEIAEEAFNVIRKTSGNKATPESVKTYIDNQRHAILVYLPAALKMGDVLQDETLDDRTNKMEGPISNWMHSIEKKLSSGD